MNILSSRVCGSRDQWTVKTLTEELCLLEQRLKLRDGDAVSTKNVALVTKHYTGNTSTASGGRRYIVLNAICMVILHLNVNQRIQIAVLMEVSTRLLTLLMEPQPMALLVQHLFTVMMMIDTPGVEITALPII